MFNQFKRVWPNRIHSLCDEYSNQMKRQADSSFALKSGAVLGTIKR